MVPIVKIELMDSVIHTKVLASNQRNSSNELLGVTWYTSKHQIITKCSSRLVLRCIPLPHLLAVTGSPPVSCTPVPGPVLS